MNSGGAEGVAEEWWSGGAMERRRRFVPSLTSLDMFIHMVVSLHVQYVGHIGHVLHVWNLHMSCVCMYAFVCSCVSPCVRMYSRVSDTTRLQTR